MSLFRELKRRNVFRVAAAYLVTAWLLIEVSATLEETLHLPNWADSLLAFFLILGFPVALFFSWAYEITPEGIKREKDLDESDSAHVATARRLDWAVIVMLVGAVGLFAADRLLVDDTYESSALSEPTQRLRQIPIPLLPRRTIPSRCCPLLTCHQTPTRSTAPTA